MSTALIHMAPRPSCGWEVGIEVDAEFAWRLFVAPSGGVERGISIAAIAQPHSVVETGRFTVTLIDAASGLGALDMVPARSSPLDGCVGVARSVASLRRDSGHRVHASCDLPDRGALLVSSGGQFSPLELVRFCVRDELEVELPHGFPDWVPIFAILQPS